MQTERGKLFDEKEPALSDDEVSKAYKDGKIAASFKGKYVVTSPENIGFIAIKFALQTALLIPCFSTISRRECFVC